MSEQYEASVSLDFKSALKSLVELKDNIQKVGQTLKDLQGYVKDVSNAIDVTSKTLSKMNALFDLRPIRQQFGDWRKEIDGASESIAQLNATFKTLSSTISLSKGYSADQVKNLGTQLKDVSGIMRDMMKAPFALAGSIATGFAKVGAAIASLKIVSDIRTQFERVGATIKVATKELGDFFKIVASESKDFLKTKVGVDIDSAIFDVKVKVIKEKLKDLKDDTRDAFNISSNVEKAKGKIDELTGRLKNFNWSLKEIPSILGTIGKIGLHIGMVLVTSFAKVVAYSSALRVGLGMFSRLTIGSEIAKTNTSLGKTIMMIGQVTGQVGELAGGVSNMMIGFGTDVIQSAWEKLHKIVSKVPNQVKEVTKAAKDLGAIAVPVLEKLRLHTTALQLGRAIAPANNVFEGMAKAARLTVAQGAVKGAVGTLMPWTVADIQEQSKAATTILGSFFPNMQRTLTEKIGALFLGVKKSFTSIGSKVLSGLGNAFKSQAGFIDISPILTVAENAAMMLSNGLTTIFQNLTVPDITKIGGTIYTSLLFLNDSISRGVTYIEGSLSTKLSKTAKKIAPEIRSFYSYIGEVFRNAGEVALRYPFPGSFELAAVINLIVDWKKTLKTLGGLIVYGVKQIASSGPKLWNEIKLLWGGTKDSLKLFLEGVSDIGKNIGSWFMNFGRYGVGSIKLAFGTLGNAFQSAGATLIKTASTTWDKVKTTVGGFFGKGKSPLGPSGFAAKSFKPPKDWIPNLIAEMESEKEAEATAIARVMSGLFGGVESTAVLEKQALATKSLITGLFKNIFPTPAVIAADAAPTIASMKEQAIAIQAIMTQIGGIPGTLGRGRPTKQTIAAKATVVPPTAMRPAGGSAKRILEEIGYSPEMKKSTEAEIISSAEEIAAVEQSAWATALNKGFEPVRKISHYMVAAARTTLASVKQVFEPTRKIITEAASAPGTGAGAVATLGIFDRIKTGVQNTWGTITGTVTKSQNYLKKSLAEYRLFSDGQWKLVDKGMIWSSRVGSETATTMGGRLASMTDKARAVFSQFGQILHRLPIPETLKSAANSMQAVSGAAMSLGIVDPLFKKISGTTYGLKMMFQGLASGSQTLRNQWDRVVSDKLLDAAGKLNTKFLGVGQRFTATQQATQRFSDVMAAAAEPALKYMAVGSALNAGNEKLVSGFGKFDASLIKEGKSMVQAAMGVDGMLDPIKKLGAGLSYLASDTDRWIQALGGMGGIAKTVSIGLLSVGGIIAWVGSTAEKMGKQLVTSTLQVATKVSTARLAYFSLGAAVDQYTKATKGATMSTEEWEKAATELALALGKPKNEAMAATQKILSLSTGMGLSEEKAKELMQMTGNLSVAFGKGLMETTDMVTAALRGNRQASLQLGMTMGMSERNTVKFDEEMSKLGETTSLQEGYLRRVNKIMQMTSSYQGLAAKGATTLSVQMARLTVILDEMAEAGSRAVEKAWTPFVKIFADLLSMQALPFLNWIANAVSMVKSFGGVTLLVVGKLIKFAGAIIMVRTALDGIRILLPILETKYAASLLKIVGFDAVMQAAGKSGATLGGIVKALGTFLKTYLVTSITSTYKALVLFIRGITASRIAFQGFMASLLTNPITLVIAALALLVVGVQRLGEASLRGSEAQKAFLDAYLKTATAAEKAAAANMKWYSGLVWIWDWVKNFAALIVVVISEVFLGLSGLISGVWGLLTGEGWNNFVKMGATIVGMWESLKGVWQGDTNEARKAAAAHKELNKAISEGLNSYRSWKLAMAGNKDTLMDVAKAQDYVLIQMANLEAERKAATITDDEYYTKAETNIQSWIELTNRQIALAQREVKVDDSLYQARRSLNKQDESTASIREEFITQLGMTVKALEAYAPALRLQSTEMGNALSKAKSYADVYKIVTKNRKEFGTNEEAVMELLKALGEADKKQLTSKIALYDKQAERVKSLQAIRDAELREGLRGISLETEATNALETAKKKAAVGLPNKYAKQIMAAKTYGDVLKVVTRLEGTENEVREDGVKGLQTAFEIESKRIDAITKGANALAKYSADYKDLGVTLTSYQELLKEQATLEHDNAEMLSDWGINLDDLGIAYIKLSEIAANYAMGHEAERAAAEALIELVKKRIEWSKKEAENRMADEQLMIEVTKKRVEAEAWATKSAGEAAVLTIMASDDMTLRLLSNVTSFAREVKLTLESISQTIWSSFVDSFSSAIADMIVEGKSFTESMKSMFKGMATTFIEEVTKMLIKWAAAQAFKSLLNMYQKTGATGSAGTLIDIGAGMAAGLQHGQTGGLVAGSGRGDKTRVMAEPGEFMVRKAAVDYYGKGVMRAINQMNIPTSSPSTPQVGAIINEKPTINFSVNAVDTASSVNFLARNQDAMARLVQSRLLTGRLRRA